MKKVLIANRSEIAVRIIRACHDLGLATVAVYSEADREALHVLHADEAVCIGPPSPKESYLNVNAILAACEVTGADAIHPGYGFLSENAQFAAICEEAGITFIGPHSSTIESLGNKANAKRLAKKAKCPTIPGSEGVVPSVEEGLALAKEMGFPLFIKASHGGGGKGIRIVTKKDEFSSQFLAAQKEALAAFGSGDLYIEKMIIDPCHIEFQIIGDAHGNYVHLGERDCSIQRRRQKLIEETPSPSLTPALREKMGKAAIALAKEVSYQGVGTVEFLLDQEGHFYFMEVNTRIQVEHTVTEEVTGIDLVVQQLLVASGEKLPFTQKEIASQGCVMQFRINAENPQNAFSPSPGSLEYFSPSSGPHVRLDTACYAGYTIPPYYDSMIAKLIVKGKDREEVIARAKRALREFHIGGIDTTIPFHAFMLENETFLSGKYPITFIDTLIAEGCDFSLEG